MAVATLADHEARLEAVVADPSLDPAGRALELRKVADSIRFNLKGQPRGSEEERHAIILLGRAQTYIGDQERRREAAALSRVLERAGLREDADIREELLAEGVPASELDAAGLPSHAELDARLRDGTLEEAFGGNIMKAVKAAAANWKEALHPRARSGRFEAKPGTLLAKGRSGETVISAKPKTKPPKPKRSPGAAEVEALKTGSLEERLARAREVGLNDWPEKGELARRLLGDAKDTQDLHTRPVAASPGTKGSPGTRSYTAQRRVVHDAIAGEMLGVAVEGLLGEEDPLTQKLYRGERLTDEEKERVREAARAQREGGKAKALFMAGGPASGKTSALRASPELEPEASVLINPDEIKDRLPEYREMIEGGEKFAASGVHEESSDLGKRLQAEAMDLELNVVVDGTGDSKPGKFVGKMRDMDAAGYEVSALYVTIPTDEAVARATARAMKSGRWVPEPEIRNQHKNVSNNFEDVAALDFLADLKLYENAGDDDPVLVAEATNGELRVSEQDAYDSFIAKRGEGADAKPSPGAAPAVPGGDGEPLNPKYAIPPPQLKPVEENRFAHEATGYSVARTPDGWVLEKSGVQFPPIKDEKAMLRKLQEIEWSHRGIRFHGTDAPPEEIATGLEPGMVGMAGGGVYLAQTPEQAQEYGEHVYMVDAAGLELEYFEDDNSNIARETIEGERVRHIGSGHD